MHKSEILALLRANPACYLATVEGDKPHVRAIQMYRINEDGIIFHTVKSKDLNKQLMKNPNVELCFFIPQEKMQIRVSGKV